MVSGQHHQHNSVLLDLGWIVSQVNFGLILSQAQPAIGQSEPSKTHIFFVMSFTGRRWWRQENTFSEVRLAD